MLNGSPAKLLSISIILLEDGSTQVISSSLNAPAGWDGVTFAAIARTKLSRQAMLQRVADGLSKSGDRWLQPMPSGTDWVVDLDQLRQSLEEVNGEIWAKGRHPITPEYDVEAKAEDGVIIYSTLIKWSFSTQPREDDAMPVFPADLIPSANAFALDHPDPARCAFVIMSFAKTPQHEAINTAIKDTLGKHGYTALRADFRSYSDDLFPNVRTYMHCCAFGIAVIERLLSNEFNPNVSLEVGYMLALRKPVCLLKDQTLPSLQSDLVGKLYHSFDPQRAANTVKVVLEGWLKDKRLI